MPQYAQIDLNTGRCHTMMFNKRELSQADFPNMIQSDENRFGKYYINGSWIEPVYCENNIYHTDCFCTSISEEADITETYLGNQGELSPCPNCAL